LKREDGTQDFWKETFIVGLPKLFGERILSKLRQNFGTNDIPFGLLTFGQLFGIIKFEGLNLCNEIKIQSKYGSEKAQFRKEMGTFCEAFGITKLKPLLLHANESKKEGPNPTLEDQFQNSPNHLSKRSKPNPLQEGCKLPNPRRNQLFATNVER